MNAMSELRYPVAFGGDTREVELKGEAYFEVKKNEAKPFIVKTDEFNVRVLGTSLIFQLILISRWLIPHFVADTCG